MKAKFFLVSFLLSAIFSINALAYEGVNINFKGEDITSEIAPMIIEGRAMVPVRGIFEEIGAKISWLEDEKTVVGEKNGVKVTMTVGDSFYTVNGSVKPMDSKAVIVKNRVMIPVRYAAQAFGYKAVWNENEKTVFITDTYNEESVQENSSTGQEKPENKAVTEAQNLLCSTINDAINNYKVGTYQQTLNEIREKAKAIKAETTDPAALKVLNADDACIEKIGSYFQQCDLYSKYGIEDNVKQNILLYKHSLLAEIDYLSQCKTETEVKEAYNDFEALYNDIKDVVNKLSKF